MDFQPIDRPNKRITSATRGSADRSRQIGRSIATSAGRSPLLAERSRAGERKWAETAPIDRLDAADRSRAREEIVQLLFYAFSLLFFVFFELCWDISEFLIYLVGKLGL